MRGRSGSEAMNRPFPGREGSGHSNSRERDRVCCRKHFSRAGLSLWWTCTSIIRSRARTSARSTSASSTISRTARSSCASYRSVDVLRVHKVHAKPFASLLADGSPRHRTSFRMIDRGRSEYCCVHVGMARLR
jgi:hypothetical protein